MPIDLHKMQKCYVKERHDVIVYGYAHTGSPSLIVTTRLLKKSELLLRIKLYLENKNTLSRVRGKLWFDEKENITMNENELIKIDDNKL